MKFFGGKKVAGGTASRAEVYGLFIAAVVLVGGGIGGAVAATNSGVFSPASVSPSPTQPSQQESTEPNSGTSSNQSGTSSNQSGTSNNQSGTSSNQSGTSNNQSGTEANTCAYTQAEINYYNTIRAERQAVVNQKQSELSSAKDGLAWVENHLQELLNGPVIPDRTEGNVTTIGTVGEIAWERERIQMNLDNISRVQGQLDQAIASLNEVPGC